MRRPPDRLIRARAVGPVIALLAIAGGCGTADEPREASTAPVAKNVRFVPAPEPLEITDPTWSGRLGGLLVSVYEPLSRHLARLAVMDMDSGKLTELELADRQGCSHTSRRFPLALHDGRIMFAETCLGDRNLPPNEFVRIMIYDPLTAEASPFAPYMLAPFPGPFATSPDARVAVLSGGCARAACLDWIRPDYRERTTLPLVMVGDPAWSPRGNAIALVGASKEAVATAESGEVAETLYVLDAAALRLQPLVKDMDQITRPSWSPDGRSIAVAMRPPDGELGLWRIDVETGRRQLLVNRPGLGASSWLPGGKTVVATVGFWSSGEGRRPGVLVVDVP